MLRKRLRILTRIGLIIAIVLSTIVTAVEWWQNPGSIYRTDAGTDWRIVQETWTSWFLPTLITVVAVALVVTGIRYLISRARKSGVQQDASSHGGDRPSPGS